MSADESAEGEQGFGWNRPTYVLTLLLLVYIVNFIDRTLMSIVAQPMKAELGLSDTQLGLLTGLAFALFYAFAGLPIARIAERRSRVGVIAICLVIWSAMTSLCGVAQNFVQLALARIGVGAGEAGCAPAAQSLIADYFPVSRRATALSIFSLGVPLGTLFGALAGSWIAHSFGWRETFLAAGVLGVVLALLLWLTIPEPPRRGEDDPRQGARSAEGESVYAVIRDLARRPLLVHVAVGGAIATFANYGIAAFAIPFLLRGYPVTLVEAGFAFGIITGVAASAGTLLGGWLTDRMRARHVSYQALVPAFGVTLPIGSFRHRTMSTYAVSLGRRLPRRARRRRFTV